ncbi:MAG TPA: YfiR/HmsC family protein, partial [bacterium]|nr:YfiR/HmsC family protein [bacterium]
MRIRKSLVAVAVATALLGGAFASAAAEYEIPPALQISILLKLLVYDRSLAVRAKDGLNMTVVFEPRNESSRACKDEFLRVFKESPRVVANTEIQISDTPQEQFAAAAEKNLDIAYVCPGTRVADVVETAHKKSVITFAPDESAVKEGIAIGLVPRDGKPKLLINVNAAIAT